MNASTLLYDDQNGPVLPDTGRQFVEAQLRQKVTVDLWPDDIAGSPLQDSTNDNPSFGYKLYSQSLADSEQNIYAPFKSRFDWEIAQWAKL